MMSSFFTGICFCVVIILIFLLIYLAIPNLIGRRPPQHLEVQQTRSHTTLTFDDGPTQVTNRLLDVLKKHHQQALFFVVGSRALNNPELIQRMVNEGHLIGIHAYHHHIHLLPHCAWKDLSACYNTLTSMGVTPRYFRPPHGFYTLTSLIFCWTHGLKTCHWHALMGDWNILSQKELVTRLQTHSHHGAVLVLHDGTSGSAQTQAKEIIPQVVDAYLSEGE